MKPRKELKPGDQVKWVGFACDSMQPIDGSDWWEIYEIQECTLLLINPENKLLYEITRRQVVAVKRKVKKPRREFWVILCDEVEEHNKVRPTKNKEPVNICDKCEIVKVREVK